MTILNMAKEGGKARFQIAATWKIERIGSGSCDRLATFIGTHDIASPA